MIMILQNHKFTCSQYGQFRLPGAVLWQKTFTGGDALYVQVTRHESDVFDAIPDTDHDSEGRGDNTLWLWRTSALYQIVHPKPDGWGNDSNEWHHGRKDLGHYSRLPDVDTIAVAATCGACGAASLLVDTTAVCPLAAAYLGLAMPTAAS
jgi:hypothetical protein